MPVTTMSARIDSFSAAAASATATGVKPQWRRYTAYISRVSGWGWTSRTTGLAATGIRLFMDDRALLTKVDPGIPTSHTQINQWFAGACHAVRSAVAPYKGRRA